MQFKSMGEPSHMRLFLSKILLMWLLSVPNSYAANVKTLSNEIVRESEEKVYVRPSDLVVREISGKPLVYQFITDYPHPHVPTNNYIKPWEVVASKPIRVKNIDGSNSRVLKKNNILYLAKPHVTEKNKSDFIN